MAHGMLLANFLSPLMNRRSDQFGGDREARTVFPRQVSALLQGATWNDFMSRLLDLWAGFKLSIAVTIASLALGLYKDEVVRWLRELADDVHAHGAAVMIKVTHLGRRTNWSKEDWLPVIAPSNVREPAHRASPKVMEDWDIARTVAEFADAAGRVQAAGLDGLELECYGHLIDQFWSPATNKRNDEYGGGLDNRMRFAFEVLRAVRDRVGLDFILGTRMVCDEDWDRGLSKAEGLEIAWRLSASGLIDFVNVIRGHIDSAEALSHVIPNMGVRSAPHLDFAGEVCNTVRSPTFHATRIQDVTTARYAIESGKLDLAGGSGRGREWHHPGRRALLRPKASVAEPRCGRLCGAAKR